MSRFAVGDHVRVTALTTYWFDQTGVVADIQPGEEYSILVDLDNGGQVAFRESELILADVVEDGWLGSADDLVNHPPHYTNHPSGIECLTITRHMGFNLGNVTKYVWRADLKGNAIEDLEKAAFYLADEIAKRRAAL